jgi:hypothetical protein
VNDLFNRFKYHPATDVTGPKHQEVRERCHSLALDLKALVPEGREQAHALAKLEEVMYWANAGIARHS